MARLHLTAPLVLRLLVSSGVAQFRTGNLKVRVTFTDGRPCNIRVRVQLLGSASTSPVAEAHTNDSGMTEFNSVQIGNYHLMISGQGIEDTDSGGFEVDSRRSSQFLYVAVRRTQDTSPATVNVPSAPTVAAADLNIPESAAQEFDKATGLIAKQEWKKAVERLNKALLIILSTLQPTTICGWSTHVWATGPTSAKLCRGLSSLNDHFAPAFVNLARMSIADRDFPSADCYV